MSEELVVRNLVVLYYYDDETDERKEYEKRLRRPKGRAARIKLPTVIRFLSEIADLQAEIEASGDETISANARLLEEFFTEKNEDLFAYVLQLDTGEEQTILENMQAFDVLEVVIEAANYLIDASFNRPEVQQALKKSDGEEPEVEEEVVEEQT